MRKSGIKKLRADASRAFIPLLKQPITTPHVLRTMGEDSVFSCSSTIMAQPYYHHDQTYALDVVSPQWLAQSHGGQAEMELDSGSASRRRSVCCTICTAPGS